MKLCFVFAMFSFFFGVVVVRWRVVVSGVGGV